METTEIFLRITLAIIVGGLIGYERELRNRPAGFVTHTLVCVGATIVGLIQIQMVENTALLIGSNPILKDALKADIGRVVAQVVTGVGFLGAGTIMVDKGSVKGLTTASTLWLVACLGIAIGLGYYNIAIVSIIMIFFIMVVLKRIEITFKNIKFKKKVDISYYGNNFSFIEDTVAYLRKNKIQVRDIRYLDIKDDDIKIVQLTLYTGKIRNFKDVISDFEKKDSVVNISIR